MKVGLVIDPVGKEAEIKNLLDCIHQRDIRTTVTFPGFTTKGQITTEASLKKFLLNGHEIVNHTDSHPGRLMNLNRSMQEQEIQIQHRRLIEVGSKIENNFTLSGFRIPLYAYYPGIFELLSPLGYGYDSSLLYSPLLGIPFKPFISKGIVEIPSLYPDDINQLDYMLASPDQIFNCWARSLKASREYFVWTIHPYGIGRNKETLGILERFIGEIFHADGQFVTLSEMADLIRSSHGCQKG
jgi:peptidoglycan/xylan/chitin deacetylase (PgdA/CDA1 family)